jgi:Protein of unknown function (DUF3105)
MPSTNKNRNKAAIKGSKVAPRPQLTAVHYIGGAVLILLLVGIVVLILRNSTTLPASASGEIEGVQAFTGLSQNHVTDPVTYPQTPPVGGPHDPVPQTCGVYTDPIKNEHAVHSLEHGAVWITYQPSLPADQLTYLQNLTRQTDHRLLSPYPGIDSPIIVTAWGYQLRLNNANDPRLMAFIQKYEQGPTTPELGAECAGETRTLKQLGQ